MVPFPLLHVCTRLYIQTYSIYIISNFNNMLLWYGPITLVISQ